MSVGRLTDLQERVLLALAALEPRWTLSGGGALAGFHTRHRDTRDLDLFWQLRHALGSAAIDARARLERVGFEVEYLQTGESFCRLAVRDTLAAITVDLVADPVPLSEPPVEVTIGGATFLVDTPHQILVNKLCAVLGRSEPRDIEDIQALLDIGGDLNRALTDCPKQDAGFSPLTLAWAAKGIPLLRLATALGWSSERIENVARARDNLVNEVLAQSKPEEPA